MTTDDMGEKVRNHWAEWNKLEKEKADRQDQEIINKPDYSKLGKHSDIVKDGWHYVGHIDVDAGLVMVGDPCYASVDGKDDPTKRHPIHDWRKFCDLIHAGEQYPTTLSLKHALGHTGAGVVVSSGEGDGSYDVYVKYYLDYNWPRPQRRISEMRVVFMDEYDDDEDEGSCCENEQRNMNGGCDNCGDPCL